MSGPVLISSDEFTNFLAQKKEIERLKSALEEIAQNMPYHVGISHVRQLARKALNPDEIG